MPRCFTAGAGERPRTPTVLPPDPKSGASANSATPAYDAGQEHCPDPLVEVVGLEPTASCTRNKHATNCATPRYLIVCCNCFRLPCQKHSRRRGLTSLRLTARCFCPAVPRSYLPYSAGTRLRSPKKHALGYATPRY